MNNYKNNKSSGPKFSNDFNIEIEKLQEEDQHSSLYNHNIDNYENYNIFDFPELTNIKEPSYLDLDKFSNNQHLAFNAFLQKLEVELHLYNLNQKNNATYIFNNIASQNKAYFDSDIIHNYEGCKVEDCNNIYSNIGGHEKLNTFIKFENRKDADSLSQVSYLDNIYTDYKQSIAPVKKIKLKVLKNKKRLAISTTRVNTAIIEKPAQPNFLSFFVDENNDINSYKNLDNNDNISDYKSIKPNKLSIYSVIPIRKFSNYSNSALSISHTVRDNKTIKITKSTKMNQSSIAKESKHVKQNKPNKIFSIKKIVKKPQRLLRLKNKLPFLRYFNPQFTKRENVDKKIIREFRTFIEENLKNNFINIFYNELDLNFNDIDIEFWQKFVNHELIPPMKYTESTTKETVLFKSFNTNYLNWIFSRKGVDELFEKFQCLNGKKILKGLIEKYDIQGDIETNDEILQLDFYINNIIGIYKSTHNSSHDDKEEKDNIEDSILSKNYENLKACPISSGEMNFSLFNSSNNCVSPKQECSPSKLTTNCSSFDLYEFMNNKDFMCTFK